jgi:pentatricopeptide repeat domain-containing protein 1
MLLSGLVPDAVIYNAAVSACEKGAQGQQAFRLLAVMQPSGLVPDVIIYNAAVNACEKGAQWQQVMQLSGLVPGVITYRLQWVPVRRARGGSRHMVFWS